MTETFSETKVNEVIEHLKTLPRKEKAKTKNQAIEAMREELLTAGKNGYSLAELCEVLKGQGLSISAPTLRSILQKGTGKRKKPATKRGTQNNAGQALNVAASNE
jgi:hypothetical protein